MVHFLAGREARIHLSNGRRLNYWVSVWKISEVIQVSVHSLNRMARCSESLRGPAREKRAHHRSAESSALWIINCNTWRLFPIVYIFNILNVFGWRFVQNCEIPQILDLPGARPHSHTLKCEIRTLTSTTREFYQSRA
jgi:hypothetical protein